MQIIIYSGLFNTGPEKCFFFVIATCYMLAKLQAYL